MYRFTDWPIRRKLGFLTGVGVAVALLFACAAFMVHDVRMIRSAKVHQITVLADILGSNAITALEFADPETAEEVLSSLRLQPSVEVAALFDEKGELLASYPANPSAEQVVQTCPSAMNASFTDDGYLVIATGIYRDGDKVGTVFLRSNLEEIGRELANLSRIALAVMAVSLGVAILITGRLQRIFTTPIHELAEAMDRISAGGDSSLRVKKHGSDEMGVLYDGFNTMLERIKLAHDRLQNAHNVLEERVAERTEELHELAYNDTLTGLPNRASILRSIQNSIDAGGSDYFALLYLDFDRFKLINDSLGHDVGDELLKEIAHRLRQTLRETDEILPARLGGDEFVVLLNNIFSQADVTAVAERLVEEFSKGCKLGPHTVYSTASIGVVTSEHRFESANDMLRDADLAMYEAKAAGKGCYAVYDTALRDKAQTRMRIESELREAISRDEFTLRYQPIVSLESHEMAGVEALIRWKHPRSGLISPDDFIPIAEETGMIVAIGTWVLNDACRQFAQWRRTLGDDAPPCIHVNVSRRQLLLPNLVTIVQQVLERHSIPPVCLHLEVTESMIMHDLKTTLATLNELRELGVKIDMDDFGTGYSSLSCLSEFPIDILKIDRSFIASVNRVRDSAALLHSVLTLADNLGMQVVSEGIEDAEQLAVLQALGCEYGQGYYFAKPLSVDDFEKYARSMKKPTSSPSDVSTGLPVIMPAGETNQNNSSELSA